MPAHVTLIAPFAHARELTDESEAELANVFRSSAPFSVTLTGLGRFENVDVVYLTPEPRKPFIELIEAVFARFPDRPPYGGAAERVVPHVTVGKGSTLPEGTAQRLLEGLPIVARADTATLVERAPDLRWYTRRSFRLGTRSG